MIRLSHILALAATYLAASQSLAVVISADDLRSLQGVHVQGGIYDAANYYTPKSDATSLISPTGPSGSPAFSLGEYGGTIVLTKEDAPFDLTGSNPAGVHLSAMFRYEFPTGFVYGPGYSPILALEVTDSRMGRSLIGNSVTLYLERFTTDAHQTYIEILYSRGRNGGVASRVYLDPLVDGHWYSLEAQIRRNGSFDSTTFTLYDLGDSGLANAGLIASDMFAAEVSEFPSQNAYAGVLFSGLSGNAAGSPILQRFEARVPEPTAVALALIAAPLIYRMRFHVHYS